MATVVELGGTVGTRHLKTRLQEGGMTIEPCEDWLCVVDRSGVASCGRLACPECGCSGSCLSLPQLRAGVPEAVSCTCGHVWIAEG